MKKGRIMPILEVTNGDIAKKTFPFVIIALAFQLMSCEYHVENEDLQGSLCNPVVSFSADIAPLIANNCMPCHNGDGTFPAAPNLTTYNGVENVSSVIREVTQSRRMPLNGTLADAEIEAIRCWIDNGALNN